MPMLGGRTALVGRQEELALLATQLEGAQRGEGAVVLVAGEPGIGKTRLAEELAARARERGVQALWGRCAEGEGAPAFWPWIQILRAWLRGRDPAAVRAALGPGAAEIAVLLPEVHALLPELPAPPALEPAQARFRLFDSLTTFFSRITEDGPARDGAPPEMRAGVLSPRAAGEGTLLILLDDLHWADTPSLALLQFLACEVHGMRLLVAGTYRDVEVDAAHPLAAALTALRRERATRQLTLGGLSPAAVEALLAEAGGGAEAVRESALGAALHRLTGGNPLFVRETVRHLVETGRLAADGGDAVATTMDPAALGIPEGVRGVIRGRLARLSAESLRALDVAAVVGREFDLATLAAVFELARLPLLEALDEALRAHLVAELPGVGPRYQFTHALIRETLYDGLGAAARVRLHGQVGEALEAVYGADVEPHLAELAWHFAQAAPAGDVEKAVRHAERAAEGARRRFADEEAVRFYELALQSLALRLPVDEQRRCELLLSLGEAQARAADYRAADATFLRAASIARSLGGRGGVWSGVPPIARAALGLNEGWGAMGVVRGEWVGLLEEALAGLDEDDDALRARLLGRLADALMFGDPERRHAASERAVTAARRADDPAALMHALTARANALMGFPWRGEREVVAAEALRLSEGYGSPTLILRLHALGVEQALEVGDGAGLDAAIAAYARLAQTYRHPFGLWRSGVFRALRAQIDGRFAEAEGLAREGLALAQRIGAPGGVESAMGQVITLHLDQGQFAQAEAMLAAAAAQQPDVPVWRCALAACHAALGQADGARALFERLAADDFAGIPRGYNYLLALSFLAEVCAGLGDGPRAATLARLLAPHAGGAVVALTGVLFRGAVAHYLGLLAATRSQWEDAARHFEAALALHARAGSPPYLARTRAARAALPSAGPAPLPAGLTAREVEVLRLLADGKTNKEIAELLVLSSGTVQSHTLHIYQKLGVRGRAEAAAFAVRHGLVPA